MGDNYLMKICERVARVEKLREGEMLDRDGKIVRHGDTIQLVAHGWDVPEQAAFERRRYRVSRVTGGGQAIVPCDSRLRGTMRVRSECMRKVKP
jgi:hypothetical protein